MKPFFKYALFFLLQVVALFYISLLPFAVGMAEAESAISTWGKYAVLYLIVPSAVAVFDVVAYFSLRKHRCSWINILDINEMLVCLNWVLVFVYFGSKDMEYTIPWIAIFFSRAIVVAIRFRNRAQYPKSPNVDRPINLKKEEILRI